MGDQTIQKRSDLKYEEVIKAFQDMQQIHLCQKFVSRDDYPERLDLLKTVKTAISSYNNGIDHADVENLVPFLKKELSHLFQKLEELGIRIIET